MAKVREVPTRGEVEERIETDKEKMEKGEELIEDDVSDIETIRKTLEELNFEGTKEDVEQVEGHIEGSEEVAIEKFEGDDEELEQSHDEAKEFEEEIEGRKDSSHADLGKISDASAEFKTQEALGEFEKVKEAAMNGIEFLEGEQKKARERIEESEDIQKRLEEVVRSGKERR